jgi:integrase
MSIAWWHRFSAPTGRHTSASLARDAEVDPEIRRKTLGHADQAMTSHYTHIEAQAHRTAAEAVARLVDERAGYPAP